MYSAFKRVAVVYACAVDLYLSVYMQILHKFIFILFLLQVCASFNVVTCSFLIAGKLLFQL